MSFSRVVTQWLNRHDLGREAGTGERPSGRQAGNASPDDEDSCLGHFC
jgi:hypothetical protein